MTRHFRNFLIGLVIALGLPIVVTTQGGPFAAQIENFWRLISTGGRPFPVMALPATTGATSGVIDQGGQPWMHTYAAPIDVAGGDGYNLFIGTGQAGGSAGNFTMNGGGGGGGLASYNVGIGASVMPALTTGALNTCIGDFACQAMTTGLYNTAVGYLALADQTTGSENTAVGIAAGSSQVGGDQNVFVGRRAGSLATSNGNVLIGYQAGRTGNTANAITTGGGNVQIGFNAGPGSASQFDNTICIGTDCVATATGQASFGSSVHTTSTRLFGAVTNVSTISITSGFGTGAAFATGANAASFDLNVGTTPGSSGVIAMPTAPHGWTCRIDDATTIADRTYVSAYTAASVTLTTTIGWTNSDHLVGGCTPF